MWLLSESKNRKAQLYITARRLLKCSIREMLTFVQGTIGFPVPNVNQKALCKQRERVNLESSVDSDFYLSLCDYGFPTSAL